jgi:hypothetical protein
LPLTLSQFIFCQTKEAFRIFEGTAEEYLPGNPAAKYLYVWKMARNCSGEVNCTEVPTGPGSYGIGLNDTA